MTDTIAAISTPVGEGGIGIIRVSGSLAFEFAEKIFVSKNKISVKEQKSHTLLYGTIVNPQNNMIIDEVLLTKMAAPNTYTREDIIEINCHGGGIVTHKILEIVLSFGVRLAEPGEFTKRAFLNGRIDLARAEAVIDIIKSKTEISQIQAANQLSGFLSDKIKSLRDILLSLIANIEVSIDYPESDIKSLDIDETVSLLINEILLLIDSHDAGKIIRDGIQAVILGKPNVGKSSLMNALLNYDRAIVTDIPGTTRDALEEFININGIPLKIIDTAGIRNSSDIIEQMGIEKSKKSAMAADLILLMIDSSNAFSKEDIQLLDSIKDKKFIIIMNKTDLLNGEIDKSVLNNYVDLDKIICMSIKNNTGIDELKSAIMDMFFKGDVLSSDIRITKTRHKHALARATDSLKSALNAFGSFLPVDLISIDLIDAYNFLGEITGESLDEDIIDKIFSEFCLGK